MRLLIVTILTNILLIKSVVADHIEKQNHKGIKPNIILFISDDHGAEDCGFIGNNDVSTPILDNFAKEGMVFKNAFAPASVCAPSRSALYTGLFPHKNGCHQNHGDINKGIKTLPEYMTGHGYEVALAGKIHVGPKSAFQFTYLNLHDIPEFLRSHKNEKPFCLIIAYSSPHGPFFNKNSGVNPDKIEPKKWMPDTPETRELIAGYYDNVENLDNEFGTSLYWINEIGIPENTIQIYTSDHGSGMPFCKWSLYEKGLHIPLIIKWEGKITPGTTTNTLVSLIDLLPTFLDVADIPIPNDIDGKSLINVINGKTESHHEYIYAAYTNQGVKGANRYPIRSIRNKQYKLIVNFNHKEPFINLRYAEPDNRASICAYRAIESWKKAFTADTLAQNRYLDFYSRPKFELYDLNNDPFEINNIYGQEDYKMVQHTLMEAMKKWLQNQNDMVANEI